MKPNLSDNIGVRHGAWGEEVAARYLRAKGMEIIDRNSRPFAHDRRLEIDIVAYEPQTDTLVFVEVKQHKRFSPWQCRLRSIDRDKQDNLRKVCNSWRRKYKWDGAYRLSVMEIYGTPESGESFVDYIENFNIFTPNSRRVSWN